MKRKTFTLLLGVLILLFIAAFLYSIGNNLSKPSLNVNLSQSSVVTKIQSLNKLETAQFTLEKIIDAGYQGNLFQNILYGDRILLIAHADVVAGFDLSKIKAEDVEVHGNTLVITLPEPEILHAILDNSKTRVYDRRTGFLAASNDNLESEARAQAIEAIRHDACAAGILTIATAHAKEELEVIFTSAGFEKVETIIPEGECK